MREIFRLRKGGKRRKKDWAAYVSATCAWIWGCKLINPMMSFEIHSSSQQEDEKKKKLQFIES